MKKLNGFTLIEILVVATIISLLAAAASVAYSQLSKQSRDARRKTDLEQVRAALEMYRSNNDDYPVNLSSLTAPTVYVQSVPTDPKSDTYSYYFNRISTSDYTLAAYLETGGANCVAGQCGGNCNYCAGPYGQK
ncbi:MAG: Type II secretion system protein G [Candidatus Roizmanbacteria bacterium GW2011_GWC2_37_13]|uniref:Type II secretion system protein G n=1 Tax=Candidatus Roizmanbacteria bacterium GW2011_GWC2_37_13 TaxID=1618486 RepID=A0A0G0INE9_9BACT|nr:MAG: Type II secretion system protein G [Candidatus Roizmanbacteria bacterium GW2011_GWC1_37_12]KKQ25699.1 MAG: Type II secretion system protein G [Candidatus Roizmanbacteria bacterium GW2011_GWC2_37_13]